MSSKEASRHPVTALVRSAPGYPARPLVVANWKMNKGLSDALAYVDELAGLLPPARDVDVGIAPAFVHLIPVLSKASRHDFQLVAQDCHTEIEGAFTGEVSAPMLVDAGARSVILGHSERRQHFGETDAIVAGKARAAVRAGLTPLICVGETLAERDDGRAGEVLRRQVETALGGIEGVEADALAGLVIAYEPVWAIGTGRHATAAQVREAVSLLRECIEVSFGYGPACEARILYGGSVSPENVRLYVEGSGVDGALVGGASLVPATFAAVVRAVAGAAAAAGRGRIGPPFPPGD